jgi:sodium-dependent phosphate cotransporter
MSATSGNRLKRFFLHLAAVLFFVFLLYVFLLSIGLLGSSFKMLGKGVAEGLIATTSNPFAGLLIGIFTTALVQSSSLTTSLVVALVSGGALTVENAVPIVMGANIGTTITCTIVSLGHIGRSDEFERAYAGATLHDIFNILSVAVIFPLQLSTGFLEKIAYALSSIFYGSQGTSFKSPIKTMVDPATKLIQHLLKEAFPASDVTAGIVSIVLALLLIFFALSFMVKFMRQAAATRLEHWIHRIFSANIYVILVIGIVVTSIIQSSSITTSMIIPMLGAGLVTLEQVFPVTVGANIGTTVTALLATLAGNQAGLTIAFVHLVFNLCGTIVFFVPPFMRKIPLYLARLLSHYFMLKKKLVIVYIVCIFFVIPLAGLFLSRLWR